mmetsp:Transcript_77804/g.218040  ORF Transcript_77804/g.218040 Transcript_77804/m.218040 type:complete len:245 (-) Transcript_77804:203-937(-)
MGTASSQASRRRTARRTTSQPHLTRREARWTGRGCVRALPRRSRGCSGGRSSAPARAAWRQVALRPCPLARPCLRRRAPRASQPAAPRARSCGAPTCPCEAPARFGVEAPQAARTSVCRWRGAPSSAPPLPVGCASSATMPGGGSAGQRQCRTAMAGPGVPTSVRGSSTPSLRHCFVPAGRAPWLRRACRRSCRTPGCRSRRRKWQDLPHARARRAEAHRRPPCSSRAAPHARPRTAAPRRRER